MKALDGFLGLVFIALAYYSFNLPFSQYSFLFSVGVAIAVILALRNGARVGAQLGLLYFVIESALLWYDMGMNTSAFFGDPLGTYINVLYALAVMGIAYVPAKGYFRSQKASRFFALLFVITFVLVAAEYASLYAYVALVSDLSSVTGIQYNTIGSSSLSNYFLNYVSVAIFSAMLIGFFGGAVGWRSRKKGAVVTKTTAPAPPPVVPGFPPSTVSSGPAQVGASLPPGTATAATPQGPPPAPTYPSQPSTGPARPPPNPNAPPRFSLSQLVIHDGGLRKVVARRKRMGYWYYDLA